MPNYPMNLEEKIKTQIRDIPNFPKSGVIYKDITPLLKDVSLSLEITDAFVRYWSKYKVDAIVGIESRGFIWGNAIAQRMKLPFVPIRKKGKLPFKTYSHKYDLEYGSAEIEIHRDGLDQGMNVLVHDDLLATGGTAKAAAELIKRSGAEIAGFSFLVELSFLQGESFLKSYGSPFHSLITY
ncbi:MAG: adenine phosphoribosyltransferase [Bacteroidota bacterium]